MPLLKVLCFFILLSDVRVFAAQDLFRPLELIEIAVRRNPEIKALSLDREATLSSRDQSRAWTNPSLELGKGRKSQPVGSTDLTRITLSQPIPALGWRAAQAQQLEAEAEGLDLERKASILQDSQHHSNDCYGRNSGRQLL